MTIAVIGHITHIPIRIPNAIKPPLPLPILMFTPYIYILSNLCRRLSIICRSFTVRTEFF